jgi:hypothetical protein
MQSIEPAYAWSAKMLETVRDSYCSILDSLGDSCLRM